MKDCQNNAKRILDVSDEVKGEGEIKTSSILNMVDLEVAKEIIPPIVQGVVDIEHGYFDLLSQCLKSSEESLTACSQMRQKKIDMCVNEIQKDIPFEQKQYYVDEINKTIEDAERNNQLAIGKHMFCAAVGLTTTGIIAGLCIGVYCCAKKTKGGM